jgi:hypothetical protein
MDSMGGWMDGWMDGWMEIGSYTLGVVELVTREGGGRRGNGARKGEMASSAGSGETHLDASFVLVSPLYDCRRFRQ